MKGNKLFSEVSRCNICGSTSNDWEVLFALNAEQNLVSCKQCGMIFNHRLRIDLENVYSDEYFTASRKDSEGGYFNYAALEKPLNKNYRFAYDFVVREAREKKRRYSILDIGCGWGFFLKQFKKFDHFNLTGIELSKSSSLEAEKAGITVINTDIGEVHFGEKFDFVSLFEFIEHSLDPAGVMKRVYEITRPGGFVLITTPNIGSLFFNLLGKRWPAIHPSSHNFYFSRDTMERLAANAGFQVVHLKERQILWRNIHQLRKRMVELFPWTRIPMNLVAVLDDGILPFLSGGSLDVILTR